MDGPSRKRPITGSPKPAKRPRVKSTEVITIEDSDTDEDFSAILAQIDALEKDERGSVNSHAPGPSRIRSKANKAASSSRINHGTIEIDDSTDEDIEIIDTSHKAKANTTRPTISISDEEVEMSEGPSQPTTKPPQPHGRQKALLRTIDGLPDAHLAEYSDFFVGEKTCSKCKKGVASPRGHVMFKGDSKLPNSLLRLLHAPCSLCRTNHCRGCMKPISCTLACTGNPKKGECTVATCCAAVRAIAIFEALGGFDRLVLGERSTSENRVAQLAEKGKKAANSVGPGGTGYGYGGGGSRRTYGANNTAKKPTRAEGLAKHWDELLVRAFQIFMELLPNPFSDVTHEYDFIPHESIGLLFAFSRLPDLLASLLRNDSVIDWTNRAEVYQAMMALLRKLADCELTIIVLLQKRYSVTETCGIEPWMWKEGQVTWQKADNGDFETDPPLQDYFNRLIKQGDAFLASASQLLDGQTDQEEQDATIQAISLCGDIIAAAGDIDRAMQLLDVSKSNVPSTSATLPLDKVYAEACEQIAFKHVLLSTPNPRGDGLVYPGFNFAADLQRTQNSTRMPKNQFRLASELAVMATSLPAGVWVRVDEVRNDAIKFMIAGPDDTPYEGGLFEFDCLMPLDYPNSPPRVHLRTTGGGKVRFNPNLYNCGKVCLSLLGTWPGRPEEQWSSTKSTLLQVIISIQSMIFIEAPYFNEPGHGQVNLKSGASIGYNKEVSYNTVRWAILDWFEEENLSGMWKEVIQSHFMIKGNKIRQRVVDWTASDQRLEKLTMKSKKMSALQWFNEGISVLESKLV